MTAEPPKTWIQKRLASAKSFVALVVRRESFAAALLTVAVSAPGAMLLPLYQAYVDDGYEQIRQQRQAAVDAANERRREAENAITELKRQSDTMLVVMGTFVVALTENDRVDSQSRRQLLENFARQRNALANARPYLPPQATPAVEAFEQALAQLNGACAAVQGVRGMRPCWERASQWAVARDELFRFM